VFLITLNSRRQPKIITNGNIEIKAAKIPEKSMKGFSEVCFYDAEDEKS
jgi:hypothetical protein